ncbi:PIN domain-containing protein [Hymenobacter terrenus]|uniref:PIN domain-containing protein n=1 Tax=Hymenobacter terrenus TaxID=1629124 RepID=UPI000619B5F1|nr:PIN domain-containing protein [Hymenobacter terrenus]
MIHSPRFVAVLDACVLYPVPIRDLLLSLAFAGLYKPKWSPLIQDEWTRNLLANRLDIPAEQLERTTKMMNTAFDDANVEGYEVFVPALTLPDPDDRHVLAVALRSQADVIVTLNLRHFPAPYIRTFDVEVQHPDDFICNLIDLNPAKALEAFLKQVARLRNPPIAAAQVLSNLRKCSLPASAARLDALMTPALPPHP